MQPVLTGMHEMGDLHNPSDEEQNICLTTCPIYTCLFMIYAGFQLFAGYF